MNVDLPFTGASIKTPVALVGFLVACVSIVYLAVIRARTKRKDELAGLNAKQKLELIKTKMWIAMSLAVLGAVVFLASLAMLSFGAQPKVPQLTTNPNERVLYYKGQILDLREDIETESRTLDMDMGTDQGLRKRGLQLADLIGQIDEGKLRPAIKIIQHEYRGWAFLMGVSTFEDTPPEYVTTASRIDSATKAVAEFDLALERMADITRDYKAGVPTAIPIYEWMTGRSEDLNRTHYLKAVALAVIARAGGGTPQAAIDEISKVEPAYLANYPVDSEHSNPDLAWAKQQSSPKRSSADQGPQ